MIRASRADLIEMQNRLDDIHTEMIAMRTILKRTPTPDLDASSVSDARDHLDGVQDGIADAMTCIGMALGDLDDDDQTDMSEHRIEAFEALGRR